MGNKVTNFRQFAARCRRNHGLIVAADGKRMLSGADNNGSSAMFPPVSDIQTSCLQNVLYNPIRRRPWRLTAILRSKKLVAIFSGKFVDKFFLKFVTDMSIRTK